jgi:hypothetical protein
MNSIYIFDLDGTVCTLSERREKLIKDTANPHRWREFYAACDTDLPNAPVIATLKRLRSAGAMILIWSARSDEVKDKTVAWLAKHVGLHYFDELRMRPAGNTEDDRIIKTRYLEELSPEMRAKIVAVFDDRDKVVAMWRSKGIPCFQVAPGDF